MNQHTFRISPALLAAALLLGPGGLVAQTPELNGVSKQTLSPGANFISAPFHRKAVHVGTATAVTASSVTFGGAPGWTSNQFGPATVGANSIKQYALIVRTDAAATPGVQGDWWLVTGNTAGTVTVDGAGQDLTSYITVGSELEIRPLTSLKDLFGATPTVIADTNFDFLTTEEDVIRVVTGTSFTGEFVYHDDGATPSEKGWYYNGDYAGDGSTLRISPNQPLMFFRKAGAAPLQIGLSGAVQTRRLTSYLVAGANAVGTGFAVDAPIDSSNLLASGWNTDTNFDVLTSEEDVGRVVNGTSFGQDFFYYSGPDDTHGWYVGGNLSTTFKLESQRGYILFRKTGSPTLIWRQSVPFTY
jgi:uncharacterized protein (TIGR02597 family)